MRQNVLLDIGGGADETYLLTARIRGENVDQAKIQVEASVHHSDGTIKRYQRRVPYDGTFGYVQVQRSFRTNKPYDFIRVEVRIKQPGGATIWVDDVNLYRLP